MALKNNLRSPQGEPTVSVVIPALNEAQNLPHVFAELPDDLHQVILVDGHSHDDTVAVARRLRADVQIISQTRKGKGNALACGFAAATGSIIVMMDADGSADPKEIPHFVGALRQADFAKGSRFILGGGSSDITRVRKVGNRWLNRIVNLLYRTRYSDLCYGYNAFRRECLPVFDLDASDPSIADTTTMQWGDGFEVETLINVRIAKAGLRVVEVPSFERHRVHGASNLNAFSDGLRVLRIIRIERERRRRTPGNGASIHAAGAPAVWGRAGWHRAVNGKIGAGAGGRSGGDGLPGGVAP
jgi:glycosyltransferase involved in cell wall biosynthesis